MTTSLTPRTINIDGKSFLPHWIAANLAYGKAAANGSTAEDGLGAVRAFIQHKLTTPGLDASQTRENRKLLNWLETAQDSDTSRDEELLRQYVSDDTRAWFSSLDLLVPDLR